MMMMMTCWWNGFRMARMSTPHDDDDDGEAESGADSPVVEMKRMRWAVRVPRISTITRCVLSRLRPFWMAWRCLGYQDCTCSSRLSTILLGGRRSSRRRSLSMKEL